MIVLILYVRSSDGIYNRIIDVKIDADDNRK
jgi:hypothetical protein